MATTLVTVFGLAQIGGEAVSPVFSSTDGEIRVALEGRAGSALCRIRDDESIPRFRIST